MKNFLYLNAKTVGEAVSLLSKYGADARPIAGGTDLLGELRDKVHPTQPTVLVNLKTITGMDYIKEDAEGLKIGALTKLDDIAISPIITGKYKALAQAAQAVGTWHLQVTGTIGGNLCQHSRCWYYRTIRNQFFCIRKGGTVCYGIAGDNRYLSIFGGPVGCYQGHPSDMAPALIALNAKVKIVGARGERTIPLEEFYTGLGNVLESNEILTEIQVPPPSARQVFIKYRIRKTIDFAIASVATMITPATGVVTDARIVLGGVAPTPRRAKTAETLLKGKEISESVAENVASEAVKDATSLSMNKYKVQITKTLVKRAIMS